MKHNRIFYPEMGIYVQFKVLDPEELGAFLAEQEGVPKFQFIINVLQKCIFNINTDVMLSLKCMERDAANNVIKVLFNGCVMLNPALSGDTWVNISYSHDFNFTSKEITSGSHNIFDDVEDESSQGKTQTKTSVKKSSSKKKTPSYEAQFAKVKGLERYLADKIIGQPEAVKSVLETFTLYQAGLSDENHPIGVFLFAGPSGVGKTLLAKEMHNFIYGDEAEMLRVDCGEFQHKHENQKLLGPPPGYVGFEEGGLFTSLHDGEGRVILLDEVEKAHPDILHTFLRAFDEGQLTDNHGKTIDFRNCIFVMTSNLGNEKVMELVYNKSVGFSSNIDINFKSTVQPARAAVERATKEAITKYFKPEFINRINTQVVFNFLTPEDINIIA